jgi:hypothetical protein
MKPTTKVRKLQVLKKVVVENLPTTNPFKEKPRQTIPSTDITTKKSPCLYEVFPHSNSFSGIELLACPGAL